MLGMVPSACRYGSCRLAQSIGTVHRLLGSLISPSNEHAPLSLFPHSSNFRIRWPQW